MNNPYQPPVSELEAGQQGAITPNILKYLRQTRPWVFLLSILGFLFSGLMVLFCIGMGIFFLVSGAGADVPISGFEGIGGIALVIIYGAMGFIYLPPTIYLFRFARAISRVIAGGGSEALETALKHQKSFWKFFGLLFLSIMVLNFIGIVLAILIPFLTS